MNPGKYASFNHYCLGIVLPVAGNPPKCTSLYLNEHDCKLLPQTSSPLAAVTSELSAAKPVVGAVWLVPGILPPPGPGY